MYNMKLHKDKIRKEKLFLYGFAVTSIFFLLIGLLLIYQAFNIFKPWMSKAQKIEELASAGIPQIVIDQVGICTYVVQPECQIIPVTYDKTIKIKMGGISSIGGRWGGSNPQAQSTLSILSIKPRKTKNWNSSISNSPYKKSDAVFLVEFKPMTEDVLHQTYKATISMDVVYPQISASFSFKEVTKSMERQTAFYTLSPVEYERLKRIEIPSGDVFGMIFGVLFCFGWAAIFIFATKHQLAEVRRLLQNKSYLLAKKR